MTALDARSLGKVSWQDRSSVWIAYLDDGKADEWPLFLLLTAVQLMLDQANEVTGEGLCGEGLFVVRSQDVYIMELAVIK